MSACPEDATEGQAEIHDIATASGIQSRSRVAGALLVDQMRRTSSKRYSCRVIIKATTGRIDKPPLVRRNVAHTAPACGCGRSFRGAGSDAPGRGQVLPSSSRRI